MKMSEPSYTATPSSRTLSIVVLVILIVRLLVSARSTVADPRGPWQRETRRVTCCSPPFSSTLRNKLPFGVFREARSKSLGVFVATRESRHRFRGKSPPPREVSFQGSYSRLFREASEIRGRKRERLHHRGASIAYREFSSSHPSQDCDRIQRRRRNESTETRSLARIFESAEIYIPLRRARITFGARPRSWMQRLTL